MYIRCTHLHSLRDFRRRFGLCSAAAHSDCYFFARCRNILTYLLTYSHYAKTRPTRKSTIISVLSRRRFPDPVLLAFMWFLETPLRPQTAMIRNLTLKSDCAWSRCSKRHRRFCVNAATVRPSRGLFRVRYYTAHADIGERTAGSVASPGFVARRGKDWNYVMGHPRWTSGPGAAAARWLIVLWVYWSKELWVVDICISWSRRLHNTSIIGSQIWKSRGARAPVPQSWRRHWAG